MIPCVLYSGKMMRSIPGSPCVEGFIRGLIRNVRATYNFGPSNKIADPVNVLHHIIFRMEPRHLVLEDTHPNCVRAAANISMARHSSLIGTTWKATVCQESSHNGKERYPLCSSYDLHKMRVLGPVLSFLQPHSLPSLPACFVACRGTFAIYGGTKAKCTFSPPPFLDFGMGTGFLFTYSFFMIAKGSTTGVLCSIGTVAGAFILRFVVHRKAPRSHLYLCPATSPPTP